MLEFSQTPPDLAFRGGIVPPKALWYLGLRRCMTGHFPLILGENRMSIFPFLRVRCARLNAAHAPRLTSRTKASPRKPSRFRSWESPWPCPGKSPNLRRTLLNSHRSRDCNRDYAFRLRSRCFLVQLKIYALRSQIWSKASELYRKLPRSFWPSFGILLFTCVPIQNVPKVGSSSFPTILLTHQTK